MITSFIVTCLVFLQKIPNSIFIKYENYNNMFVNDSIFKVYMKDTSLFISMLDYRVANLILSGDLGTGKGAIYENIVAYAFAKNGRKLYYYKKILD